MIPGEIIVADTDTPLPGNTGLETRGLTVANTGDRPIQVGSHFHFFRGCRVLGIGSDGKAVDGGRV